MRHLVLALALIACSNVTAPPPFLDGEAARLEFTMAGGRTHVAVGDTMTVLFTLRNPTADTVRLAIPLCLGIVPKVRRGGDHLWQPRVVCPAGGPADGFPLAPGASIQEFADIIALRGGTEFGNGHKLHLPPGSYTVFAEISSGLGRTNSVTFRVD